MEKRARSPGAWLLRIGVSISCLLALALGGLGMLLSGAIRHSSRVLGSGELLRLTREDALQVIAMDESLLQSHRELLHFVVNAVFVAAGLVILSTVLCAVGFVDSRRGLSGGPPSEAPKV